MKPKPLEELKNFTVPMAMMGSFTNDRPDGRQEGENIKSGSVWARRARGGSGLALLLEQSHNPYAPLFATIQGGRDLRTSSPGAEIPDDPADQSALEPRIWRNETNCPR